MTILPVAYSCMALSYNPRPHHLGTVSMLLSSIAIMNIGDDEEDGLQDATPISLVDLFGGLRHVSCLQKPTVKVLNIALLVWSSFSPHICNSSKKHFLHSSLLQLLRAQGTEEMGARPCTVSPHNFYPTVKITDGSLRCK